MKETKKLIETVEGEIKLDISKKTGHRYGFFPNDEITTPFGVRAIVVGYRNGIMFFQKDRGRPISWDGKEHSKEKLLKIGFKLIKRVS